MQRGEKNWKNNVLKAFSSSFTAMFQNNLSIVCGSVSFMFSFDDNKYLLSSHRTNLNIPKIRLLVMGRLIFLTYFYLIASLIHIVLIGLIQFRCTKL